MTPKGRLTLFLCAALLVGARAGWSQAQPDRQVTDILTTKHGRYAVLASRFGEHIVTVGDTVEDAFSPDETVASVGPDFVVLRRRGGPTERLVRTPFMPASLPTQTPPLAVEQQAQALSEAIYNGPPEAVAAWVQRNPALLKTPYQGRLPLETALATRRVSLVGLLLAAGTDVNARDPAGETALNFYFKWTGQSLNPTVVHLLLDLGADVNAADAQGDVPLDEVFSPYFGAGQSGDPRRLYFSLLLARGADPDHPNVRGATPLFAAVTAGRPTDVAALLAAGADVNRPDQYGERPIHRAMRRAAPLKDYPDARFLRYADAGFAPSGASAFTADASGERVEALLVAHRARLDAADPYGWTPLWYALLHRDASDLTLLLPHPSAHDRLSPSFVGAALGDVPRLAQGLAANPGLMAMRGPGGVSLLQIAALWGQAASVRFLLAHGADPGARDALGQTPLHAAIVPKQSDVLALLLTAGAPVDPADRYEATPLTVAVRLGDVAAVRLLLAHHADPNGGFPAGRPIPDSLEITRLLLEAGADSNREPVPGRSLLLEAIGSQNVGAVRLLLAHGADPNGRGRETPLLTGIANPEIMEALLDKGADANAANGQGATALMLAARDARVVRLLLAHGANVNARDDQGQTALMRAVSVSVWGSAWYSTSAGAKPFAQALLKPLLDAGADVNAQDDQGQTALGLAQAPQYGLNRAPAVAILKAAGAKEVPAAPTAQPRLRSF